MAAANSSDRSGKPPGRQKATARKKSANGSSSGSRSGNSSLAAEEALRQLESDEVVGRNEGLAGLAEQLANRILKPLGLVVLSRERIAETVQEAAERGRLTRSDADRLVAALVQRGRQQTEELLSDLDRRLGRGRQQIDLAARRARKVTPDRLVRGADRARRTIGMGSLFPIRGYDDLTVAQVQNRLPDLSDPELRQVRDYERRHGNRKSLLAAIEKALHRTPESSH
jgi:polyhydroxyalkanoate synthesis regulator phasin